MKKIACKKNIYGMLVLALLFLVPLPRAYATGYAEIQNIKFVNTGDYRYKADGVIAFRLTNSLQQALLHGVKLRVNIDFFLGKHRIWWWNSSQHLSRISYQLSYHALSKHYVLKRLGNKPMHWNFSTLPAALKQMGKIKQHVLPALNSKVESGQYYFYVKAGITTENLSLPLRVQSYFKSNKYRLESEGFLWALP